jgi:phototropin
VSKLVLALKNPRSLSESLNSTIQRKSQDSTGVSLTENSGKGSSEPESRRVSRTGLTSSLPKISEVPEGGNKTKKSGLRSFKGYRMFTHKSNDMPS